MVSIVTINYNGWCDTCELIDSLHRVEDYPYEIIVVDNASSGDDVAQIRSRHPSVCLIQSERNLGFAGGNNLGLQYTSGEHILFLNNDMVVKTPILKLLVERLAQKEIGGVSPCIRYLYQPENVQYYGYRDMTSITLKHTTKPFDATHAENFLKAGTTDVLHGGAMMVRRDVIERVGMMTEVYFLFYEEFDWCLQMRKAGYRLFYEPASVVYHKESVSIPKATPLREYYLVRSRLIYARRNVLGWRKLISCLYLLCVAMPKKVLDFIWHGRADLAWTVWKGTFSGLLAKRR